MQEIKRGDIFYADLGDGNGSEQAGIRPVLILQNDTGNMHSPTTIAAAITSKNKTNLPTHVRIAAKGLKYISVVMLEQIKTIDKSRLMSFVGRLDDRLMSKVESAALTSLGIQASRAV